MLTTMRDCRVLAEAGRSPISSLPIFTGERSSSSMPYHPRRSGEMALPRSPISSPADPVIHSDDLPPPSGDTMPGWSG